GSYLIQTADDLRDVAPRDRIITRVLAFGREGHVEKIVATHPRTCGLEAVLVTLFKDRDHDFFGSSRIGRALEYDQLAGDQIRRNRFRRSSDVTQVRLVIFVQRRRNADDDRVHRAEHLVISGRAEAALACFLYLGTGDAMDI